MDNKNPDIAEYDLYKYDYEKYWLEGRKYEDESDKLAVKRFLKNETGDWYIDIGGSYGRLLPLYQTKSLHCVLTDYSIEALKKARNYLKENKIANVNLVAANIYSMPFKNAVFSAGQMIRVAHHLEDLEKSVKEISRIISPRGFFILEFANKIHFIAKLRAILKFDFKFLFDKSPYKQPPRETRQGISTGEGLFYNFHPDYVKEIVGKNDFDIKRKLSVSNFRSIALKKILKERILLFLEKISQPIFSICSFGPSQYYKLKKSGLENVLMAKDIYEIICCPKCKSELFRKDGNLFCKNCGQNYPVNFGIFDLRWPKPGK